MWVQTGAGEDGLHGHRQLPAPELAHHLAGVPFNISTAAKALGASGGFAVLFPSQIFEDTADENYEEVRGWFHLKGEFREHASPCRAVTALLAFTAVGGAI